MYFFIFLFSLLFGQLLTYGICHPLVLNITEDTYVITVIITSGLLFGISGLSEIIEEDNDRAEGGPLNR